MSANRRAHPANSHRAVLEAQDVLFGHLAPLAENGEDFAIAYRLDNQESAHERAALRLFEEALRVLRPSGHRVAQEAYGYLLLGLAELRHSFRDDGFERAAYTRAHGREQGLAGWLRGASGAVESARLKLAGRNGSAAR